MAVATSINNLMHVPAAKLAIPAAPKIPILDRHHYSSSGSDYGGYSHGSSSHKKSSHSIALSALTLLAFLFFLNILQNCLQEHMDSMNPQVVVVTRIKAANREAEKRKGDDGILVNASAIKEENVEVVDEVSSYGDDQVKEVGESETLESRLDEVGYADGERVDGVNVRDKYFVKLVSRQPSKEIKY